MKKLNQRILSIMLAVMLMSSATFSHVVYAVDDNPPAQVEVTSPDTSAQPEPDTQPEPDSQPEPGTQPEPDSQPEKPACSCTEACTAEQPNTDCPHCKSGQLDCGFVTAAPRPVCSCKELCVDEGNLACKLCAIDAAECISEVLPCSCTVRCNEEAVNEECLACGKDWTHCSIEFKMPDPCHPVSR